MSKKVIVVTLHGMGDFEESDSKNNLEEIEKELFSDQNDPLFKKIEWKHVNYSIHFNSAKKYWKQLEQGGIDEKPDPHIIEATKTKWLLRLLQKLSSKFKKTVTKNSRYFFLTYFGDPITYLHRTKKYPDNYHKVHKTIYDSLKAVYKKYNKDDYKFVILAHSLGGYVLSNYMYDAQQYEKATKSEDRKKFPDWEIYSKELKKDKGLSDFVRLKNLDTLITYGCNISLFVAGMPKVQAIKAPSKNFAWYNYYDTDDILGWPLRPLGGGYEKVVNEDIFLNVGAPVISHTLYPTKKNFQKKFKNKLEELLKD